MTGGNLDLKNYYIGYNGTGTFVLSNGVVTTTYWQTFIGANSGSDGTFVQSGGTNTYSAASCYIGRSSGSNGRYIMNGGTLNAPNVSIGDSGTGYMEINGGSFNVPGTFYAGYYASAEGTLVLNNYTNTFPNIQIGPQYPHTGGKGSFFMNGGEVTITGGGYVGARPGCESTFVQNGGVLNRKGLTIPFADDATATCIFSNNAVTEIDGSLTLKAGGTLKIYDADINCKGVYIKSADSEAVMNDGSLIVAGRFLVPDGTNAATFHMKGGYLTRTYVPNQSYMFYIGGATASSGPGSFIQSGGVVTNSETMYLGRYSTNHVGRYEISGGTLDSQVKDVAIEKTRVAEFCVKGSAPVINLRSFNAKTNEFSLEFVLDKSPEHLAPVNFTYDRAYRCGHLHVGMDGGVLLSKTNQFTLLRWTNGYVASSYDYLSRPDTNMWTEEVTADSPRASRITLSDGYKQADLSIGGTSSASFAEHAMGHVTVANLSTNRLTGLVIRMDVNEQAKSVSNLVADMIAAGYTNSVVESFGDYDLKLVIPPDCVVDKSVESPSIFAWDFTDPTTGVTNATVTAVSVEMEQSPAMGTLLMLQ